MDLLIKYIFLVFISGFLSSILVPYIIKFGSKYKIVDIPNNRKKQTVPIVRIGGIAIFVSITISLLIAYFFNWLDISQNTFVFLLLSTSFLVFLIGLFDDIFTISPFLRLIFQIIISSFVWAKGIRIDVIDFSWVNNDLYFLLPNELSLIFTVFWISAIINAFNWLDGLDGLAAGTCIFSTFGFSLICFSTNQGSDSYLLAALIGSCIGFLNYNFYKAKIYMGDCGSYFIGFCLSLISIHTSYSEQTLIQGSELANFFLPFLFLMLPIADMVFVIFRRIYNKKSPFLPDRNHFHHRLLNTGFDHKNSVLFSYALNQLFVCMALAIHFEKYIFPISITSIIIFSTFLLKRCDIRFRKPFEILIKSKN